MSLKRLNRSIRWYLAGSACMGAMQAVSWALLNLYLDRIGFSKSQIGAVQAADSWGKVLIAIPAAFLLSRQRTPPLLVASGILTGTAFALVPWLAPLGLGPVMIATTVMGLGWSVHFVATAPFLFRHAGVEDRAMVFGLAEAARTLAAVFGAFVSGQTASALTGLLGDEAQALRLVLSTAGCLALFAAAAYSRIAEDTPPSKGPDRLGRLVREHALLLTRFAIPQLVIAFGAGLCMPFLALYFKDRFGFSPASVGNLHAAGQILMTTGFLASSRLQHRLGFLRATVLVEWLSIPFFLILAHTFSPTIAIFAFLVRGALMNTAHPIFKHFAMHVAPEGTREIQNGITSLMWGLGWVFGPYLGGYILDRGGNDYTTLMHATMSLYLVAGLVSLWLLRSLDPTWPRSDSAAKPE